MTSRAVLFSGDPETGKTSMDVYDGDDPFHRAQAIMKSCEADFPNRVWAIYVNDEARAEMARTRMKRWGFTDEELREGP